MVDLLVVLFVEFGKIERVGAEQQPSEAAEDETYEYCENGDHTSPIC